MCTCMGSKSMHAFELVHSSLGDSEGLDGERGRNRTFNLLIKSRRA